MVTMWWQDVTFHHFANSFQVICQGKYFVAPFLLIVPTIL